MFRKAHLFFTMLCGGTTSVIIIILSLFYLHTTQNNLYANAFHSFTNDIGTIAVSLEQSANISMQWLSGLEARNEYQIFVIDNGIPFLYNKLHDRDGADGQTLLAESLDAQNQTASGIRMETEGSSYSGIRHSEYEFRSPSAGQFYFCSLIDIQKDSSASQIVILSPLKSLRDSLHKQRLFFLFLNLAALAALFTFAWIFTGLVLKPLKENHEKQTRFIAAASHELRTPLAVILATNECCQNASVSEQAGFFQTIAKEGQRMNSLIDDMLSLTHTDMQRFPLDNKPTELDTLCLNAYESFEPLCRKEGLTLSLVLPDAPIERCICDPDRIAQVLSVLLHNAISYTPSGGSVKLALNYHRDWRGSFEITVSDTGIGIDDDDKRHIFDRFYRAEKSRITKGHFGLGLAIAYEIVTSHHGVISVRDNPAGGSIFTVRLP